MKRLFATLLCITLISVMFAGCAGNNSADNSQVSSTTVVADSSSAPEESVSTKSDEPVALRFMWWGGDARHKATLDVIDSYMKLHPNVRIDGEYGGSDGYLEKLSTQLYSGTAAELLQVGPGWVPDLVSKGDFFVDFSKHTDKIDMSGFDPEYLKNTTVFGGIQTGLPSGIAAPALITNKTLLQKAGIDLSNLTWDGLIEAGTAMQTYNQGSYLINTDSMNLFTFVLRPYIMQLTGRPFLDNETKQMSFTKEQLVEVLNYIKKLYDSKTLQPAAESAAFKNNTPTNPKWIDGSFGASLAVSSTINTFTSANTAVEYDVVNLPLLADRKDDGFYSNPPQIMCIPKTVEANELKLATCFSFYDYFFNDASAAETLKDLRSVPPTTQARKVCEEKNLIAPLVLKSVEIGLSLNGTNEMGLTTAAEVETICVDMIEKVAYGQGSVEQIADESIKLLSDYLANL